MTINREAAEQMAARLTSTISSAVDAAETFNEALRLATVALQETRDVPEVEPGTVGTATVRGVEGVRVVRTDRSPESDLTGVWFTPVEEQIGGWWHPESEVTSFVPDPDTAALRDLLEIAEAQRNEANARADAAETRLARVSRERIAEALKNAYAQIHNQDPRRKYAVSEVKQIVYPLLSLLEEFDFHEVEAAHEQAANISQPQHDPIACGDPSCDC